LDVISRRMVAGVRVLGGLGCHHGIEIFSSSPPTS
jgi:hypothetical protein